MGRDAGDQPAITGLSEPESSLGANAVTIGLSPIDSHAISISCLYHACPADAVQSSFTVSGPRTAPSSKRVLEFTMLELRNVGKPMRADGEC